MGTAILTDRPLLRWQAFPGATSYFVAIFDENFEKVTEGPAVERAEWQPVEPLPRGRILNWQVTARTAAGSVRSPVPPAPEARFTVVTADGAANALEEAAKELEQLSQTDRPTSAVLLASLADLRKT